MSLNILRIFNSEISSGFYFLPCSFPHFPNFPWWTLIVFVKITRINAFLKIASLRILMWKRKAILKVNVTAVPDGGSNSPRRKQTRWCRHSLEAAYIMSGVGWILSPPDSSPLRDSECDTWNKGLCIYN